MWVVSILKQNIVSMSEKKTSLIDLTCEIFEEFLRSKIGDLHGTNSGLSQKKGAFYVRSLFSVSGDGADVHISIVVNEAVNYKDIDMGFEDVLRAKICLDPSCTMGDMCTFLCSDIPIDIDYLDKWKSVVIHRLTPNYTDKELLSWKVSSAQSMSGFIGTLCSDFSANFEKYIARVVDNKDNPHLSHFKGWKKPKIN